MRKLPKWLDRTDLKAKLREWLSSNNTCYCINVSDSQEIQDIVDWIPGQDQNKTVVEVYFDSDTEVKKYSLLENIVNEIGIDRFNSFKVHTELDISQEPNVTIQQVMGENIASEDDVTFRSNTQTINIQELDPTSIKLNHLEKNINGVFNAFLNDIKPISRQKQLIIVCCFRGIYSEIDKSFKGWFEQIFLRKIQYTRNVKVFILLQNNEVMMLKTIDYHSQSVLKELSWSDIIEDSEKHITHHESFCNGLIDPVSQNTTYQKYKLQLTFALDRQMSK